jgi:hypothetical protein
MQKISSYLYSNIIQAVVNLAASPLEWRIVYQRKFKIYQGLDNVLELDVKNAEQKRIDITNYDMKFVVMDQLNQEVYAGDVKYTLSPITTTSSSKSGSGPFLVTFVIPTQNMPPTVGNAYIVTGNSNALYNGTYISTASSTTSITLRYASDPGIYGTGTTTIALKLGVGLGLMTIPASALDTITPQFLKYTVYILNDDDTKTPVYGDTQFGVTGTMDLLGGAMPTGLPVKTIKTFTYEIDVNDPSWQTRNYHSESIEINPVNVGVGSGEVELTFSFSSLAAPITVQTTTGDIVSTATNWTDVETFNVTTSTTTVIKTYPIDSDTNWLRISYTAQANNTGTIDKVIARL